MNRRGISPVIATVLFIAMVVVIGLIIFLWLRGITEESITKFGGKNIKLVCDDISFEASYSDTGILYISNIGNVPIWNMEMRVVKEASYTTKELSDWPPQGLGQAGTFSSDISSEISGAESIVLIPVLIGKSEKGEKTFMCEERYGYELII